MTDNEIIKALENCSNNTCLNCPCNIHSASCLDLLTENALDLINRQKAEIERLENKVFVLENDLDKAENLSEALGKDVDIKLNYIYGLEEKLKTAKSEAIKEFAVRLKETYKDYDPNVGAVCKPALFNDIDNLVKKCAAE